MEARLDYAKLAPEPMRALFSLGAYLEKSGLERPLLELVKIRASQMNGCAYCIDMHKKDARAAGETEQRIYALSAWRETPFFSDRERAALVFGRPGFPLSDVPLQAIAADVEAGRYGSKPSRVFRFEEIQEAHRVMESNQATGKMVVVL